MKLFADTADHNELSECFDREVNDGITTNPKIMENAGVSNFKRACRAILERYPNVPVSLETDLRGIPVSEISDRSKEVRDVLLEQAHEITRWASNVVVKIPICYGGILAVKELHRDGINTNVTGCMTSYQALAAANAGATYVSLFANRMLDANIIELSGRDLEATLADLEWKDLVKTTLAEHRELAWRKTLADIAYVADTLERDYGTTELIVGSIRDAHDIYRIQTAQPQIITVPHKIALDLDGIKRLKRPISRMHANLVTGEQSLYHPMTSYTLEEFEKAADSYRPTIVHQ